MDVRANRYDRTFSNAQVTEPAFGNYLTMGEVLTSLEETAQETYQTREDVIRALLRRHQRDASGYLASVLLVVFAPMLVSLRARLRGSAFESGELDQIVVEGFLLAIAAQETPPRLRSNCGVCGSAPEPSCSVGSWPNNRSSDDSVRSSAMPRRSRSSSSLRYQHRLGSAMTNGKDSPNCYGR